MTELAGEATYVQSQNGKTYSFRHGTLTGYAAAHCKCELCRRAGWEYRQQTRGTTRPFESINRKCADCGVRLRRVGARKYCDECRYLARCTDCGTRYVVKQRYPNERCADCWARRERVRHAARPLEVVREYNRRSARRRPEVARLRQSFKRGLRARATEADLDYATIVTGDLCAYCCAAPSVELDHIVHDRHAPVIFDHSCCPPDAIGTTLPRRPRAFS